MSKAEPERRTSKVTCPHCKKVFTVRFAVAGEEPDDKEGTGRVGVDCLHCSKTVMVTLARPGIEQDDMLRGDPD